MRYQLHGRWHVMLDDEAQAIERSGPPHDVRDYAGVGDLGLSHPMAANTWPEASWNVADLMRSRPVPVPLDARPVQKFVPPARSTRSKTGPKPYDGPLHFHLQMSVMPACGVKAPFGYTLSFHRFAPVVDMERCCERCKVEWLSEWARRKRKEDEQLKKRKRAVAKRGGDQYVKPMRWTADEKKRLDEWRKGHNASGGSGRMVTPRGIGTTNWG